MNVIWNAVLVVLTLATGVVMGWVGIMGMVEFLSIPAASTFEWVAMACFEGVVIGMVVLVVMTAKEMWS